MLMRFCGSVMVGDAPPLKQMNEMEMAQAKRVAVLTVWLCQLQKKNFAKVRLLG